MSELPRIYLDNAATTRVSPKVAELVCECMLSSFGNPSSAHHVGIEAERRIKTARAQLGAAIGDRSEKHGQILWTSGGTESNALGVLAMRANTKFRKVVVSAIEHPAVRQSAALLKDRDWQVANLNVNASGAIDLDEVDRIVDSHTGVLALMLVNNEIGTILPIAQIAKRAKAIQPDIHIHCDAVQALGKIAIDVTSLGVDSIAFSAHKLHGPKGVGALWLKRGTHLRPFWAGGGQQGGLRSGTENVPGIAGFGAAVQLICADIEKQSVTYELFAKTLVSACKKANLRFLINGEHAERAPHILSLAFDACPAEPLLHVLESRGVLVSAGSACSEKSRKPSAVLSAIAVPTSHGTIRLSFGCQTTAKEVTTASEILVHAVRSFQV